MEPRSWQWIQGAVIAAAIAIGIAGAVWYENRPVAAPAPLISAAAPKKKQKVRVLPDEGIITGLVPVKSSSASSSVANGDSAVTSAPASPQYPVMAWQKEAVDPMAHTSAPATPAPVSGTPPLTSDTMTSPGATGVSPSPGVTGAAPLPGTTDTAPPSPSGQSFSPSPMTSPMSPSSTTPVGEPTPTDSGTQSPVSSAPVTTPGL